MRIIIIDDGLDKEDNTGMRINSLQPGEEAEVTGLGVANPAYRHKLLSMGLTPGTRFVLSRVAPLGDPVEILLRGYSLSLRKDEAAILIIRRITP